MKRLLREPLVHFLVLGAALFAAYTILNRDEMSAVAGQIMVTQGRIESLQASFSRVWQRPPTPEEVDGLIQDYIREEVLAREAIAMGLDQDDSVIRRRLRQKMEFIATDLAAIEEPSEADLEKFLADHPDRFAIEPRFTFRQVYLSPDKRGDALEQDAARILAELRQAGAESDFLELGDSTMLSPELVDVRAGEVDSEFGTEFTRQLEQLATGEWNGPVISGYGVHLVLVEKRQPGRLAELSEVRDDAAREWADSRRRESNEKFYQEMLKRYTVTIEPRQDSPGEGKFAGVKK